MEKSPKPVSSIAPFGLRMQPALKQKIEDLAKANARSMNSQIVAMLESFLHDLAKEEWEGSPEYWQQTIDKGEADYRGLSVSQIQAQRRTEDQIRKDLLYLRNHVTAISQRLLSLETMRQAMLTERAILNSINKGNSQQQDQGMEGVDERIRAAQADLDESQTMLEALLPLDPDSRPRNLAPEPPKERSEIAKNLPKVMDEEIEDLLERVRRKQIADLLAKK